jgi:hypothetical protein
MVVGTPDTGRLLMGDEAIDRRLERLQRQLDELTGLIREVGPHSVLEAPLDEVGEASVQKQAR